MLVDLTSPGNSLPLLSVNWERGFRTRSPPFYVHSRKKTSNFINRIIINYIYILSIGFAQFLFSVARNNRHTIERSSLVCVIIGAKAHIVVGCRENVRLEGGPRPRNTIVASDTVISLLKSPCVAAHWLSMMRGRFFTFFRTAYHVYSHVYASRRERATFPSRIFLQYTASITLHTPSYHSTPLSRSKSSTESSEQAIFRVPKYSSCLLTGEKVISLKSVFDDRPT